MKPYLNLEYFYDKIYEFFKSDFLFVFNRGDTFQAVLFWVKTAALILSIIFAAGILYNLFIFFKLREERLVEMAKGAIEVPPEERKSKWEKIKKYLSSSNASDWRQAIMEADSLLDEIVKKIGYKGETFGERLSKIKPAQFKNLQEVWQAHKIRNRIAHEGMDFKLSKEEAERVVGLYKKALEELEYL